MENQFTLPEEFQALASEHFVLLHQENQQRDIDSVSIRLSGYSDVAHLISDIVKVSILALGDGEHHSLTRIPEPASNVSGILSIILDLIPYEEFELLDKIRRGTFYDEVDLEELYWERCLRR